MPYFLIPFGKGSAKYWLIGIIIFVVWLGIYIVYERLKLPNFLNIVIYYSFIFPIYLLLRYGILAFPLIAIWAMAYIIIATLLISFVGSKFRRVRKDVIHLDYKK